MSSGEHPLVSIIVPTFNRRDVVQRCLSSALEQDAERIEVIVVDDGSTDDTLVQLAAIDDARLTVMAGDHAGAPAARNRGLEAARGDWVLFLDSDDWLAADHVSTLLTAATSAGVDACYSGFTLVDSSSGARTPRPPIATDDPPRDLLYGNFIATGTLLVRTDLARQAGGYDPLLPARQDLDFNIRISDRTPLARVLQWDTCFVTAGRDDRITVDKAKRRDGFESLYRKHRSRMSLRHRLVFSKRLVALGFVTRDIRTVARHLPLGLAAFVGRVKAPR